MKRKRTLTMLFAVGGILVALAVLFNATGASVAPTGHRVPRPSSDM